MTTFIYPPPDARPWPTLGLHVCDFIEDNLCFGPGDLLGHPVVLSDELRAWICKMYEVEPPYVTTGKGKSRRRRKNPRAGRRRFQRCVLSLRKGSSKTEIAAWLAACELHQDGPVRCAGFNKNEPIPCGVTDPYIPMISYTEEQTEELAYGALRRILEESRIASDFDIGLDRIMRARGDGKAEAVTASPNARDGARTTFQHCDESHRLILEGLKRAWVVMLANLAKRPMADPWALETTTAPEPGADSVAEGTMRYAYEMAEKNGNARARLFFYHRQASDKHDLDTDEGLRAAVEEASGPYISKWSDIDRIMETFREPDADLPYLERVWLNRPVQAAGVAFDVDRWKELGDPDHVVPDGALITMGFDGSRYDDATALVATEVETGFQWPLGVWGRPPQLAEWEVPIAEVAGVVDDAFERWEVVRMYCDPPKWESWIATWAGRYGDKKVTEWWTNRRKPMAYAIRAFKTAMRAGEVTHNGDRVLITHVANSRRLYTQLTDEEGKRLWILRKERPDSPKKIDAAMAAILSWEARTDAVSDGLLVTAGDLGISII